MTEDAAADPTEHSRWRPFRLLHAAMDVELERIYADRKIDGLKSSYVMELLRLHHRGPMTIKELAVSVQRTHSAMSQKVAAMRAAGFVTTTSGTDARTRLIMLTPKAEELVGLLTAEWRAVEAAIAELEAESDYPLSKFVTDVEESLRRKSFYDRVLEKLAVEDAE